MTREDIIRMARDAGYHTGVAKHDLELLKAFEALVRADEREQYKWDIHSCGPTCKRYACVAMREAIEAEREACAKLAQSTICDTHIPTGVKIYGTVAAKAIRARGQA